MKKWIVILLVLVCGGVLAYKKLPALQANAESSEAHAGRKTEAVAEERDIRFAVPAAGEISPAEQVSVKPEINGRIEILPVDIGDTVKKGQLLFSLDDKELQNEKASSVTEVERAKLQLAQAERNYKRGQELFEENLIAQELFEQTKTEFDLSKNGLERAQRMLDIINERLTKTKIMAPFDCTILTRPVSIGQAVSGSGGFNSGTEVLSIADLKDLIINAHINQADITRLRNGQEVEVQVEAVPGLTVFGTVERIAPQATIRNNIKGFAVRILLKDVDKRIRPGMTANIKIPVAAADNVVAVPLAAVFTERNQDTMKSERFVYVKKGLEVEKRQVAVGVADFMYAEIQEGLRPGEVVLLEPPKAELEKVANLTKKQGDSGSPSTGNSKAPAVAAPQKSEPTQTAPARPAGQKST